jgi:hypothetical protein
VALVLTGGWLGQAVGPAAAVPGGNGLLAFASNRDGKWAIFAMQAAGPTGRSPAASTPAATGRRSKRPFPATAAGSAATAYAAESERVSRLLGTQQVSRAPRMVNPNPDIEGDPFAGPHRSANPL